MALGITPIEIVNKATHPLLVIHSEWERVELSNIADVQNGYAFSSELFNHTKGLPLIRIRDIFSAKTENYYSGVYSEDFVVYHNDILIGMDGDFKISRWPGQKGLLNQRVCRIKFFSSYYLESFLFICVQPYLDAIHSETSAVTVKHLSSRTINDIPVPLPPLPIQRAIVSKIEALFSDLDNGIANFKTAQAQLKIYRQAVLKKAFEGELTKEWREKQTHLPTAEDNLPKGWKWVNLGDVIEKIEAGKSFRCEERPPINDEVGVLKVSAVTWEEFSENESKTIKSDDKVNQFYFVKKGDFLFSRANTLELVGRSVIVKNIHRKLMLSDKTLRFKFLEVANPYFILYFLRTNSGRKQIESLSTGNQISMRNIGQSRIKKIVIPLCSLTEQTAIVQEIESRLSVCDKMEQSLTESIAKAETLRQSILKKAFEGKLLSEAEIAQCKQAADYEPASELLKKIQAEKLANSLKKTQKNGKQDRAHRL